MADANCHGIISNPALAGIGTRVNIYTTVFLAAVVPKHHYTRGLLEELYINGVFYSFALLITALVETIKGQLDLYHAIFVMQMLSCFGNFQFYVYPRFATAKKIDFKLRVTYLVQSFKGVVIMPPWLLYVWIKVSRFGAQPECNHLVKFVFLFVNVRATVNWLRIFMIVLNSSIWYYCLTSLRTKYNVLKVLFAESYEGPDTGLEDAPSFIPWLLGVTMAVQSIVCAELTVHRNRPHVQPGEDDWGFGQVVSVMLLLPIFMEILAVLKKIFRKDRHEGGAGAQAQAQAQAEEAQAEVTKEGTAEAQAETLAQAEEKVE